MNQASLCDIMKDQTDRALWEVENVVSCIPDDEWNALYCGIPLYRHIYHMLHSLDRWLINPNDSTYRDPSFHIKDLNNLDVVMDVFITRDQLDGYFHDIKAKITAYLDSLTDEALLQKPDGCKYTRFTLILAQHRHLHTHMGMLMGFIIAKIGHWPRVLGLEREKPKGEYNRFF